MPSLTKMISKELISWDALNGIAQYHHYDSDTGTSTFESIGDATPVLEANKALAKNDDLWRHGMKEDFVLYASIPAIVQLKLLHEQGIDVYKKEHGARLSRVLEHPDYRYLKCVNKTHLILEHD